MTHAVGRAAIHGIGTAIPPHRLEQSEVSERLARAFAGMGDTARWARRIFKQSGVDTRYTCEPNLLEEAELCRYVESGDRFSVPSTTERMRIYEKESVRLAADAAGRALLASGTSPEEVTYLITVSCTGMFLPGLDVHLAKELKLKSRVNRYPLTFLGCAAGLTALRLSRSLLEADSEGVVLIVCVELCTLHLQPTASREALYASAFFGDGASACVVTRRDGGWYELGDERTFLLPDSEEEISWRIGSFGFDIRLSTRIPKLIGEHVPRAVSEWLGPLEEVKLWAIHPGGRGIVDALESSLGLTPDDTSASRAVLRNYGNLSSATLLFVLQHLRERLLARGEREPRDGVALAFGPGVSAEMLRIRYLPGARRRMEETGRLVPAGADGREDE